MRAVKCSNNSLWARRSCRWLTCSWRWWYFSWVNNCSVRVKWTTKLDSGNVQKLNIVIIYRKKWKGVSSYVYSDPFVTGYILECDWNFEPAEDMTVHVVPRKKYLQYFVSIFLKLDDSLLLLDIRCFRNKCTDMFIIISRPWLLYIVSILIYSVVWITNIFLIFESSESWFCIKSRNEL